MAKLTRTIDVRLGDVVDFMIGGKVITGTVQCITEFPDIFVETGVPSKKYPGYKRYRISVNEIVEVHFKEGESIEEVIQFDDGEPLEFVYGDDMVTRNVTSRYGKSDAITLSDEGKCELCGLPNDTKESPEADARTNGETMIPIDVACKWVSEHCYDYLSCDGTMEPYYIRKNDFASDFRDAMEGEFGNGYRMVDLGLPSGLKWADRNVGAESPEAYGGYFMWGSTKPDTNNVCDWAHAPFNNGSEDFGEAYFNAHRSEWLDGDALKPEYDAAHVIMGGSWRMPTSAEMLELIDRTTRSAETLNGIDGVRFTSKANGNSIFMPFCGYRYGSDVSDVGSYGYAWSSSLDAGDAGYSLGLDFFGSGDAYVDSDYRYYGFVVRGVHE